MKDKLNFMLVGFLGGIILPLIVLFIFYESRFADRFTLNEFIGVLNRKELFPQLISICAFPNLLIFYPFIRMEMHRAARGVVFSVLAYTLAVVYLKFFM